MGWGEKAIEIRSVEKGLLDGVFMHKRANKLKFLCERNDKGKHFWLIGNFGNSGISLENRFSPEIVLKKHQTALNFPYYWNFFRNLFFPKVLYQGLFVQEYSMIPRKLPKFSEFPVSEFHNPGRTLDMKINFFSTDFSLENLQRFLDNFRNFPSSDNLFLSWIN